MEKEEEDDEEASEESEAKSPEDKDEKMAQSENKSADDKSKSTDLSTKSNSQQKQQKSVGNRSQCDKLRNANENRTLAGDEDREKRLAKNCDLIDADQDEDDESGRNKQGQENEDDKEMDQDEMEHVKDENERHDMKAFDAATESQKRKLNEMTGEKPEEITEQELLDEKAKKQNSKEKNEAEKLKKIEGEAENKKGKCWLASVRKSFFKFGLEKSYKKLVLVITSLFK